MTRLLAFLFFSFCGFSMNPKNEEGENATKEDFIKFGGAVRLNTAVENYEHRNKALNGYAKLDTWFLSVNASKKALI